LINFSGEIEKDIVWRHSEFTLYRGHIINKSNEVLTSSPPVPIVTNGDSLKELARLSAD